MALGLQQIAGGDAEVEHLDQRAVRFRGADEQIGRLDVAMNDAKAMGHGEPGGCLAHDLEDLDRRQRTTPLHQTAHRLALEQLHGDEGRGVLDAVTDHPDHVGMSKALQGAGFASEATKQGRATQ